MKIVPLHCRRLASNLVILLSIATWSCDPVARAQTGKPSRPAIGDPSFAQAAKDASAGKAFSVEQKDGTYWLVRPNGERFFSFGVNCVGQGTPRESFDRKNPGYAAWQHYPDAARWAEATLQRLKSWGVTTIGGWSDFQILQQCRDMDVGFLPVLHIGSTAGAPWFDMWDPKIVTRMDQVARDQILPLRDDPRLIGYYSDNEIGWWNATLFQMTLEQVPTSGQRQRLIDLLKQTYQHDWQELTKDFEPEKAGSWQELERQGTLHLRPGGNGVTTMRRFLGMIAERYYSLVHDIIRKYDPRALILGDRYQSFYYPEVARASAPYVDVVSTNLNAGWNDGTFPRFYLDTLHALTGKPILVSEFYMAARDNRSGNKNDHGVYPVVATQEERAAGFRNTLQALVRTPYVVGADWFQYYDEPTHGREDGENFNFGLVDIQDRPYEKLTQTASSLRLDSLKARAVAPRPDGSQGVPRAPRNPLAQFQPTLALKDWDRERGFVKPVSEFPLADLYISWDEKAIYLGIYAQDIVEDAYYRDKMIRNSDRTEWTVTIGESGKVIRAQIGTGAEAAVNDPTARIISSSGKNRGLQSVAAMELPAKLFGRERFQARDRIEVASTLVTYLRAYHVAWRISSTLRSE